MDHDGSTDPQLRSASISFVIPGLLLPELRELRLQGRQLLVDPVERRSETKRGETRRNEAKRDPPKRRAGFGGKELLISLKLRLGEFGGEAGNQRGNH